MIVHGDAEFGKRGCAATRQMRIVLAYAAQNAEILAPTVWSLCAAYGLDKLGVDERGLVEALLAGGQSANHNDTWDATPEQIIDIAVKNGASYVDLIGLHQERFVGLQLETDKVFDNRAFAEDHLDEAGKEQQAFAVALGKYIHDTVDERVAAGEMPHQAALHAMRGIAYTLALTKSIVNQQMNGVLMGKVDEVTASSPA